MSDTAATYHLVKNVLKQHRRCFEPDDGPAFCSCNKWWYPNRTDDMEWHEHAAQHVAWALDQTTREGDEQ